MTNRLLEKQMPDGTWQKVIVSDEELAAARQVQSTDMSGPSAHPGYRYDREGKLIAADVPEGVRDVAQSESPILPELVPALQEMASVLEREQPSPQPTPSAPARQPKSFRPIPSGLPIRVDIALRVLQEMIRKDEEVDAGEPWDRGCTAGMRIAFNSIVAALTPLTSEA